MIFPWSFTQASKAKRLSCSPCSWPQRRYPKGAPRKAGPCLNKRTGVAGWKSAVCTRQGLSRGPRLVLTAVHCRCWAQMQHRWENAWGQAAGAWQGRGSSSAQPHVPNTAQMCWDVGCLRDRHTTAPSPGQQSHSVARSPTDGMTLERNLPDHVAVPEPIRMACPRGYLLLSPPFALITSLHLADMKAMQLPWHRQLQLIPATASERALIPRHKTKQLFLNLAPVPCTVTAKLSNPGLLSTSLPN